MRYKRHRGFGFCHGFHLPFFGFPFCRPWPFPRREDYLRMLERYKEDLEAELREVEKEIDELKKKE